MELMDLYSAEKREEVVKFEKKSLKLSLLMISGQTSLLKALFYPCIGILPINGLEYEYDYLQKRTSSYNNDVWRFNWLI